MSDEKVTPLPIRAKGAPKILAVADSYAGCQHRHAIVDEKLSELECSDCHARLNPIHFLAWMAREVTSWDRERQLVIEARKQLEERRRTTCEHCGKMTRISRR